MDTPKRARQSRAIEKRGMILAAAIDLMFTSGLTGVTHRQVATRASVPVGSIGYYFNTRDELLVEAVKEVGRMRKEGAHAAMTKVGEHLSTQDLASVVLEVFLPKSIGPVSGWLGIIVDCARESESLGVVIAEVLAETSDDISRVLESAGRTVDNLRILNIILTGAVVYASGSGHGGAARGYAEDVISLYLADHARG